VPFSTFGPFSSTTASSARVLSNEHNMLRFSLF
jgi:hypothetical protein